MRVPSTKNDSRSRNLCAANLARLHSTLEWRCALGLGIVARLEPQQPSLRPLFAWISRQVAQAARIFALIVCASSSLLAQQSSQELTAGQRSSQENTAARNKTDNPSQGSAEARMSGGVIGQQGKATEKLNADLLELLNEPAQPGSQSAAQLDSQQAQMGSDRPPGTSTNSMSNDAMSIDARPLLAARDGMFEVTQLMRQGRNDGNLVRLQADVINNLETLIRQLEQQQNAQQNQKSQSQQSADSSGQTQSERLKSEAKQSGQLPQQLRQASENDTQSRRDSSDTGSSAQPESQSSGQQESQQQVTNQPGQDGQPASTEVRTKSAVDLQQDVWGHLPSRVRSQMQSRMVEEFLPTYRERIEAYYRQLLEEGNRQ